MIVGVICPRLVQHQPDLRNTGGADASIVGRGGRVALVIRRDGRSGERIRDANAQVHGRTVDLQEVVDFAERDKGALRRVFPPGRRGDHGLLFLAVKGREETP